jgi:hypothetical protein
LLLIGSHAAKFHFPDHRPPNDWDLIVNRDEHERLYRLLGPPLPTTQPLASIRPHQSTTTIHRFCGEIYELKLEAHLPLWSWVCKDPPRTEEGETVFTDPLLGDVRLASPSLLLLLKQSGAVHPVHFWRKTLLDYHFLKTRTQNVPVRMIEGAHLARARMEERFLRHSAVTPWRPATCAPVTGALLAPTMHADFHKRYARGPHGPLAVVDRAWEGFPTEPPATRRSLMIELLVEEALVLAATRQTSLPQPAPLRSLFNWTLRLLITQELPLRWAYFAVDEYREIQSRLMKAEFSSQ